MCEKRHRMKKTAYQNCGTNTKDDGFLTTNSSHNREPGSPVRTPTPIALQFMQARSLLLKRRARGRPWPGLRTSRDTLALAFKCAEDITLISWFSCVFEQIQCRVGVLRPPESQKSRHTGKIPDDLPFEQLDIYCGSNCSRK